MQATPVTAREKVAVTVHLPSGLLRRARKATGGGVTETVRQGLQMLAAREAQRELTEWRGRYKSRLKLRTLRNDR
jgi:hypothetical protein